MRLRSVLAMLGMVALVSACSGTPAGPVSDIKATLADWNIDFGGATGKAGSITFTVTNNGANTHEFVIVKTDLKADSLPVNGDTVDESAFEPVDEIEDIESGTTQTLTVNLPAGHYVILCNIEEHYSKGMHQDLTVE
jgi:uncharacterized cupredoxin-like copper-binding protein